MKGRIVGRNGRNIRAFEQVAGVDVIVDDTPEAVTVSCFDPVRREVARRSLARLILDGRIHPAHIEKILNEEQRQVEKDIEQAGEQAAFDANVAGLHPEILKVMGRLKYRTSYGQNQLAHAVEVSKLAAVIASELGADMEICKAGALLHDLGKAMDHNTEGTHAMMALSLPAPRRDPKVVNCIARTTMRSSKNRWKRDRRSRRCHLWCPPRRPPRRPGAVHQAPARSGRYRQLLQGRQPELCHPGRARSAHHGPPRRYR
jgi:ribonucrease Y